MNRVTPQQVIAAYEKTGLRPITGNWLQNDDGSCSIHDERPSCGCGMGALYVAAGGTVEDSCSLKIAERLGLELDYVNGFSDGFDGLYKKPQGAWREQGYQDGQAAAAAVGLAKGGA